MNVILSAKNIDKTFQKSKEQKIEVVKNVSLEIEKNKITAIIGASGAGKSTLLHILSGLDNPDGGEVLINGTDIFRMNDEKLSKFRNDHIGFVFQFHHLLPEFTALENIAIPKMIGGMARKEAEAKAIQLLETIGLTDRATHKPAELSGGEQQRIAVARALINDPDIIFADEPTGNLDSKNSMMLHELFVELKNKLELTFLIVSHNPELVELADIVWEMKDGQIFRNK